MPSPKQQKSANPKPSSPGSPKQESSPQNNPAAALFNNPAQKIGPDKKLNTLIDSVVALRKRRMKLEAQVDLIEKKEEELESTLCTVMISKNMKSIKRTNGIMVIAGQKHEFFIKPETKEDFFKYLRKSGEGYLISTSVNYQTLQGHMNRLLEKSLIEKSAEKTVKALKPFLDERTRNQLTVKGLKGKQ